MIQFSFTHGCFRKGFPFQKPRPQWVLVLAWGWRVELMSRVPLGMTRWVSQRRERKHQNPEGMAGL